jgi:hypothetical protein
MIAPSHLPSAVLAAALFLASPALAYDGFEAQLRPEDRTVIQTLDARFDATITATAGAKPSPDIAAFKEVAAGTPIAFDPAKLVGKWRCRSLQADQDGMVFSYPYFDCEIRKTADGAYQLVKPTGSQRRMGQFWPDRADRMGYTGAMYFGYDKHPLAYGENPERDEAGYLYVISPKQARLHVVNTQQPNTLELLDLRRK